MNRLLIIFQVIVLILAEIGWPASFFATYFPVLGPDFGLGALGIFQCLIGATILSHHVDDFTLVAAFFLFSIGCINMFLGLFREKVKHKRSILSWREEAKGVLPLHKDGRPRFARPASTFVGGFFNKGDKAEESTTSHKGYGFGRQGEKAAGLKGAYRIPVTPHARPHDTPPLTCFVNAGFLISKPLESLPRYAQQPRPESSRAGTPEPKFKSSPTAI